MSSAHNFRVAKPPQRTPTCDMCRTRHQKCGGEQPQCSNCKLRAINCSYSSSKTRVPETIRSPESTFAPPSSRPSISDADYERLYAEIFGDIVRRFNLDKEGSAGLDNDALLEARPGNASLPAFHREVSSIVREQTLPHSGLSALPSDANPIKEPALERGPDHVRKIMSDSLPSHDVSCHLLDMFFDHQNSIFYVCNREEIQAQLTLMYEEPAGVSISWFCQMFLIFALGVQFDDLYETDATTYHEIGQKYIDDAIDEQPQNTIWVIRAMLLLCIYQPPTKWNSIWMNLDAAIRGAQRFQLDVAHNQLNELSDDEYQEWRRVWLTIISFDRWVAIFLGRLPRIKESISRDPIFKDPNLRMTLRDTPQNYITTLAIISGDILRDMYFSEQSSLNVCRQYKTELEKWVFGLPHPLQQHIQSGEIPNFPKDMAESTFNLYFMHLGACMLVTRPFLLRALRMKTAGNFGGPIVSAIASEATLCIEFASRLIQNASGMLGSSFAPRKSFIPVFFLINAAHIMVLAAAWKLKQSRSEHGLPGPCDQDREQAALDTAIRTLEFCGHRNPFARRYSSLLRDLQRQLLAATAAVPNSVPSLSSSASVADSDPLAESPYPRSLGLPPFAAFPPGNNMLEDPSLEGWMPRFGDGSPGYEDLYNSRSSFL
ncbi:hypothetical protein L207DRAFT_516736 [Hyaloscypha variabilis F]|uniref:Zn(2)-C6 fungal-type domain-containing protein n=1 Tax=Hyaloscypha variabilis (strain UAMH 11265 / GT02V1 / F) TaxID=1149755 RepID=A0A2J6R7T6_HYAVF|nr:hypothetical protein L207DRAFT_516736 [Hyaloscypha variabilis F]